METKDFKKLYLKYKGKYLHLKNQLGGDKTWNQMDIASKVEVKEYYNTLKSGNYINNCPTSYYSFTEIEPEFLERRCIENQFKCNKLGHTNVSSDGKKCIECMKDSRLLSNISNEYVERIKQNTSRLDTNNEVNLLCNPILLVDKYFKQYRSPFDTIISLPNGNNITNINSILLDTNKYLNESANHEIICDKDLICLEGNIIYTDSRCKVGSGSISSCMFMVFVLDDDSFVSCHMNGFVTSQSDHYIGKEIKYKFSHDNCFKYIKENYPQIKNLKKVYIVGILVNYSINETGQFDIKYGMDHLQDSLRNKLRENKNEVLCLIKKKLQLPIDKNVEIEFKDISDMGFGNFIYASNNLHYVE